jgi:hypothetical protein
MRNILSDLRERLGEAREEQRELAEYIQSIEQLIALEERRAARQRSADDKPQPVSLKPSRKSVRRDRRPSGARSPIKDFLVQTMGDGRAWSLDRLKEAAEASAINFEGKSAGKVLHFTLVALKNSGQADYDKGAASWRLTAKGGADRQLFDVQPPSPKLRDG